MSVTPPPVPGRVVADVGGTNTRVGLVGTDGTVQYLERLRNDDYPGLVEALQAWRDRLAPGHPDPVDAALAVAAPLTGEPVSLTNRPSWQFTRRALREALGVPGDVYLLNDFTAVALSVPHLGDEQLLPLGPGGRPGAAGRPPAAPVVVLGPGSGLGVSALFPHGGGYCAIESEGGHATLAAHDAGEAALVERIRSEHGHVSCETLLCGAGLVRLHAAVAAEIAGTPGLLPAPQRAPTPAAVVRMAGSADAAACRALQTFFAMLGSLAGSLALTFGAWDGVYLAGGILPCMPDALRASAFRSRFSDKGRYASLLETVPTALITASEPALLGLASFTPALLARAGPAGPARLTP